MSHSASQNQLLQDLLSDMSISIDGPPTSAGSREGNVPQGSNVSHSNISPRRSKPGSEESYSAGALNSLDALVMQTAAEYSESDAAMLQSVDRYLASELDHKAAKSSPPPSGREVFNAVMSLPSEDSFDGTSDKVDLDVVENELESIFGAQLAPEPPTTHGSDSQGGSGKFMSALAGADASEISAEAGLGSLSGFEDTSFSGILD